MSTIDKKVYILSCKPETGELVESLAKHIDGGIEAVFQKGVLLLGIALKAIKSNNRIAIIDKENNIVDIIEGF